VSIIVSVIGSLQCKSSQSFSQSEIVGPEEFNNSNNRPVNNEDLKILSHWKFQDETRALSDLGFNTHFAI
jgi:hypothetical protein